MFREAGWELHVVDRNREFSFDNEGITAQLAGCHAIFAGAEPYTAELLDQLPDLRIIARTGVGFDAVDLEACDERGIVVTTTPGVNHHSVAEHTIALLMGVARLFPQRDQNVRSGNWIRKSTPRVMGSTLGIIGLGRIGQATATRAIGLGLKVIAEEPYPNQGFVDSQGIELVSRDEIFARSDYLSLHCPMTPENHHLINADSIAKMKPTAVLLNTARGLLVDETALYDALKNGKLRGAGLDVFEVEPLPLDSPLLELDNLFMSSHVAGHDQESHDDTFALAANIIMGLHNGEWPEGCVQNQKGVTDWNWNRE